MPSPGEQIGKYVIQRELGRGGMGAVYQAKDPQLGRSVALKMLHPQLVSSESTAIRFRKEAEAMARVSHPNVVVVHDFVAQDGKWAIVMEYIEGGRTLEDHVRPNGLPWREVLDLGLQMARGLGEAHSKGIVHRDVKPSNVVLSGAPGEWRCKVADFGLARLLDHDRRTQMHTTLGTLYYLAPEQAMDAGVDSRADVYSIGATLYELLTGKPPFNYESGPRIITAHLTEPPEPPSTRVANLPGGVDALVLGCLRKDPDERPKNGSALAKQITALIQRGGAASSEDEAKTTAWSREQFQSPPTAAGGHMAPHYGGAPGPGQPHVAFANTVGFEPSTHGSTPPASGWQGQPPGPAQSAPQGHYAHGSHGPPRSQGGPLPVNPEADRHRAKSQSATIWVGFAMLAAVVIACLLSAVTCVACAPQGRTNHDPYGQESWDKP